MFYVYVLRSDKDGGLYTGFTSDLRRRITKHNEGKVFSTKARLPLRCIYTELCLNEDDARQRERYLKTGVGKRFIKQRLANYFKNIAKENT